jgi:uncharacterized protein YndB with AHSA1/START domain
MVVRPATSSATFEVTTPSDCVIRMTRVFNAPRQLVFDVMNKPEHVAKWWGKLDDRYSMPICEIDFRPGGAWRYVGRGPQGDYGFHGVYREIDAPARLVFTEIFDPFPEAESVVTVELEEQGDQTHFTITVEYPSLQVRDAVIQTGMAKGAAISYDRLEDVAESLRAL